MTNLRHNFLLTAAILLSAAVVLTLPIYYFGIPGGNDLPQHFRFIHTFHDAVQDGTIYPFWPGDTNLGFGDVGIRFYPPLAYYAVVLFRTLTSSWTAAISVTICFWFCIGGLGTFLLARESLSEKASLAAALVFMAMPYHANQVYNAGLFAEFAGIAILPFCFLFTRRIISSGSISDVVGLATFFALLILTHIPLVIIGSIGLAAYALLMANRENLPASFLKLGSALLAAVGASAFYWLRMVTELNLVNHTLPQFTDRTYDFHRNFLAAILYLPSSEYGDTSAWFTDLLFVVTMAMVVPAAAVLFHPRFRSRNRWTLPLIGVLVLACFVASPLSIPIWNNVGILQKIQFPWRFLGLISLVGSLLVGGLVDELPALFKTKLRPIGLTAVGLLFAGLVFTGAQVIRPATHASPAEFDDHFGDYRSDRSYECWWPVGADKRAFTNRERVTAETRSIEIVEWTSGARSFVVGEGGEETLRVATFYYPFWKATSNGEAVPVTQAGDGTMTIAVPAGRSTVHLSFEQPFYETAAGYCSLVAWIFLAVTLILGQTAWSRRPELI